MSQKTRPPTEAARQGRAYARLHRCDRGGWALAPRARLHQLVGGPLNGVLVHVGESHRCARFREFVLEQLTPDFELNSKIQTSVGN
jgi:hypothetical protein